MEVKPRESVPLLTPFLAITEASVRELATWINEAPLEKFIEMLHTYTMKTFFKCDSVPFVRFFKRGVAHVLLSAECSSRLKQIDLSRATLESKEMSDGLITAFAAALSSTVITFDLEAALDPEFKIFHDLIVGSLKYGQLTRVARQHVIPNSLFWVEPDGTFHISEAEQPPTDASP